MRRSSLTDFWNAGQKLIKDITVNKIITKNDNAVQQLQTQFKGQEEKNDKFRQLIESIITNNVMHIQLLLNRYPDLIAQKSQTGDYPIHVACLRGSYQVVKLLIDYGCDLTAVNQYQQTPYAMCKLLNRNDALELIHKTESVQKTIQLLQGQKLKQAQKKA